MRKRRGKNAAPVPVPVSEQQVFPARVAGKKLYVKMPYALFEKTPMDREQVYDWAGPQGASYATLEYSSAAHGHSVTIECKIFIFDAAGNLLGEVIEEHSL